MCGIAGIFNICGLKVSEDDLKKFTDSMAHRGPDGAGYEFYNEETVGFGHRRLSILDLSDTGKQPMYYADKNLSITYNGEIFNFQEIKDDLISKGYIFRSDSDTEVILAAYHQWGKQCMNKFNGMWAFAIWDNTKKEIFLARDRFGIKPLYYVFESNKRFAFASETRAFKYLNNFNRRINTERLKITLANPYELEGQGYTIFEEIYQLLPGHYMVVNDSKHINQRRWWNINENVKRCSKNIQDQSEEFYELFRDSCKIRLVSDVPVATALSGGLDSTAVYTTVFDIISKGNLRRVNNDAQKAFTAVFPDLIQDESMYAKIAVEYTGGKIHLINSYNTNLAERIERETEMSDFINNSPISSLSSVYKGMRNNGIYVSLDGHGVDEMMYGYRDMIYCLYNDSLLNLNLEKSIFYKEILSNMYHPSEKALINSRLENEIKNKKSKTDSIVQRIKEIIKGKYINTDYIINQLPSLSNEPYIFSDFPIEERMLYTEFFQNTLPSLLRNFDRASMINGVEIRMPFMDWRLVSFVFSLPITSKINNGFTKYILRESMRNRMEESLRTRTYKVGISSPINQWINKDIKEWAFDMINDRELKKKVEMNLKMKGFIDSKMVREIWQNINFRLIN